MEGDHSCFHNSIFVFHLGLSELVLLVVLRLLKISLSLSLSLDICLIAIASGVSMAK